MYEFLGGNLGEIGEILIKSDSKQRVNFLGLSEVHKNYTAHPTRARLPLVLLTAVPLTRMCVLYGCTGSYWA